MSTTKDATDEQAEQVEEITEDTLIPIRIGSGGSRVCIGNKEETLNARSTWTRYLVYATAESILRCESVYNQDRGILSTVMDSGLEFESYTEEAENRFGRPALQIVADEGEEAYDELRSQIDNNAFLHAAIKGVSVYEAGQELERKPVLPIFNEDGDVTNTIGGGYGDPDLVAGAVHGKEDEVWETDLRDLEPDLDFVLDNWSSLGGGHRGTVMRTYQDDESAQKLRRMARNPTEPVDLAPMILKKNDGDFTTHGIREIEESIVEDEEDRVRSYCGMVTLERPHATVLELDLDSISESLMCSLCQKSMDYDFDF